MTRTTTLVLLLSVVICPVRPGPAQAGVLDSENGNTYHYVERHEVLIDAEPVDVWPVLLDMAAWMDRFDMLHESGPAGAEGQVFRLYRGQDFFLEIVKIVPERMLVATNLPATMQGEESVGVSMITLTALDGRTLVSNFMSRHYAWPSAESNPLRDRRKSPEFESGNQAMWRGFLSRLQALVEEVEL